MSQVAEVRPPSAADALSRGARGLIRWVCTSNPFYAISALLVCLGLWMSFGAQEHAAQSWALMAGLAGYTLLLAATACLLVRFGGVWDDVRTVLLLVVLMFLATSVTFDEVLAREPGLGIALYVGGFGFAVAVSEGLLRGMRLRLPAPYRAAYYLVLGLFFLYPVGLVPLLDRPRGEALQWGLFGFAPAAGLAFLTLIPAARRGPDLVRENGSPWRWPLYPWTLFGLLGLGVMARAYLLCVSMQHLGLADDTLHIFGPYFLAPFVLAVGWLFLEAGRATGSRGATAAALIAPIAAVALAAVGHRHDPIYWEFLARFTGQLGGTPLFLTLVAGAGYAALAALRRVPGALGLLTLALGALAVVGPGNLDAAELDAPRPLPIAAIATLHLALGWRRRESWRCLFGAACAVGAALIVPRGAGLGLPTAPIAAHLAWLAVLIVGALFDDALGRLLRNLGVALALAACLATTAARAEWGGLAAAYPVGMAIVLAGYGLGLGHRPALAAAGLATALACGMATWDGYRALRLWVPGLDPIALGLLCFGVAAGISAAKAAKGNSFGQAGG